MGRQGEGGGLKILKNEETSFMDDPLGMTFLTVTYCTSVQQIALSKLENIAVSRTRTNRWCMIFLTVS